MAENQSQSTMKSTVLPSRMRQVAKKTSTIRSARQAPRPHARRLVRSAIFLSGGFAHAYSTALLSLRLRRSALQSEISRRCGANVLTCIKQARRQRCRLIPVLWACGTDLTLVLHPKQRPKELALHEATARRPPGARDHFTG